MFGGKALSDQGTADAADAAAHPHGSGRQHTSSSSNMAHALGFDDGRGTLVGEETGLGHVHHKSHQTDKFAFHVVDAFGTTQRVRQETPGALGLSPAELAIQKEYERREQKRELEDRERKKLC